MNLFSSRRERRLWLWAIAVIAVIFASLGFSGSLVDLLTDDNVAAVAFGLSAVFLMLLLRLTLAERTHLIEYGVLAVFVHAALTERMEQGRQVRAPALIAVFLVTAIGLLDESIQLALPHRVFDPEDLLFNTLAAVTTVSAGLLLAAVRRRVRV